MNFMEWIKTVNQQFLHNFGLGVSDLPDIDWQAEFETGTSPHEMPYLYAELYDDTELMQEIVE